jgi:hypothetical protein
MPTAIGLLFFGFGAYYFLAREDGLLGLLLVASIFQAASAVDVAERGIQPCYLIEGFIIVRAILNQLLPKAIPPAMPNSRWLLAFAGISTASALLLPVVFAGMPVYAPKVGIDEGFLNRPPLSLGLNNAAQGGFLIWHIVAAYAIRWLPFSSSKTRKALLAAFYLVVFFVFSQSLCHFAGITYPDSLTRNNPGYQISDLTLEVSGARNPGSFSEPSFAGAFLVFFCIGFIADYLEEEGSALRVVVALLASSVVASSGSLFTILIFVLALLIRNTPFRFPWFVNVRRFKRVAWILLILVTPLTLVLVVSPAYRETLASSTVFKGDTGSFQFRTASDLYALQLLLRTYGLGVGMGSNRASSLLTSMLSNIGVAGCFAFAIFISRLFNDIKRAPWIVWAFWALLLNMVIDIPDVTFPTLWVVIMLALSLQVCGRAKVSYQVKKNPALALTAKGQSA